MFSRIKRAVKIFRGNLSRKEIVHALEGRLREISSPDVYRSYDSDLNHRFDEQHFLKALLNDIKK